MCVDWSYKLKSKMKSKHWKTVENKKRDKVIMHLVMLKKYGFSPCWPNAAQRRALWRQLLVSLRPQASPSAGQQTDRPYPMPRYEGTSGARCPTWRPPHAVVCRPCNRRQVIGGLEWCITYLKPFLSLTCFYRENILGPMGLTKPAQCMILVGWLAVFLVKITILSKNKLKKLFS